MKFLVLLASLVLFSCAVDPEPLPVVPAPLGSVNWTTASLSHGIVTGRYYAAMLANPEGTLGRWANMGVKWIRIEFEDKAKGLVSTPLTTYATIIKEAHNRGIRVLGVVGVNSMDGSWFWDTATQTITAATVDAYVAAADAKLAMGIDAIEISNEPWAYGFGAADGSAWKLAGYGKILTETYVRLKGKYPKSAFMGPVTANAEPGEWYGLHGAPTGLKPEWSIFGSPAVQAYRDAHAGKLPLDVISLHPYGTLDALPLSATATQANPGVGKNFLYGRDFVAFINWVKSFKDQKGRAIIGDYPIVFSEYAWDTKNGITATGTQPNGATGATEILGRQRSYFETLIARVQTSLPEVKAAFIYTWQDDENTVDSEKKCFGLIRNSVGAYAPKPIYTAFAAWASGSGLTADNTVIDGITTQFLAAGGIGSHGLPTGRAQLVGTTWTQTFSKGQTLTSPQ